MNAPYSKVNQYLHTVVYIFNILVNNGRIQETNMTKKNLK